MVDYFPNNRRCRFVWIRRWLRAVLSGADCRCWREEGQGGDDAKSDDTFRGGNHDLPLFCYKCVIFTNDQPRGGGVLKCNNSAVMALTL